MSYNALDNLNSAKALRDAILLERTDLRDSLSYEMATSWCSNCPQRRDDDLVGAVATRCCKEDEVWAENHESEFKHDRYLTSLLESLNAYINSCEEQ